MALTHKHEAYTNACTRTFHTHTHDTCTVSLVSFFGECYKIYHDCSCYGTQHLHLSIFWFPIWTCVNVVAWATHVMFALLHHLPLCYCYYTQPPCSYRLF